MKHKLNVYFLGQFKIVLDDSYELTYNEIGSKKNAKLLAYLLKNYNTKLTSQDILNVMFADESSNNPSNALKGLIYRLRTTLKKYYGNIDIVLTGNSTYYINPEIEVILDIEEFDNLSKKSEEITDDEKIVCLNKAVDLYHGSMLPMFSDEQWVIIAATYEESTFLTITILLLKCYLKDKKYEMIERLSNKALEYDPLNESIHYYLIKSLILQNKISVAKTHYLNIEKFLYDELGIYPNEDLKLLYEEIISSQRVKESTIDDIQNSLIETKPDGAFQCSYEVFKNIYQLEARRAMRNGINEYILLLTIQVRNHISKNSDVVDAVLDSTSSLLNQTILSTLRTGDSFSKYSNQQYVILLPNCNNEDVDKVTKRIIDSFYKADKYQRVTINYKIDEIRLAGECENDSILSAK